MSILVIAATIITVITCQYSDSKVQYTCAKNPIDIKDTSLYCWRTNPDTGIHIPIPCNESMRGDFLICRSKLIVDPAICIREEKEVE